MTGPFRGIACKILSVTCFTLMAACVKSTAAHVPSGQAVFFRSFFAIPVILAWLVARGDLRHGLDTVSPLSHAWRGIAGTTSMMLIFAALGLLPLPEATALTYATPLLVVIFAAMFLGEQVRAFRLGAVAMGLLGVLIVLWPRMTLGVNGATPTQTLGALLAVTAAVFAALAQVFVRKMVHTEQTASIVFYFSVTGTCVGLLTIPFGWVLPDAREAALLVGAGLIGGVGQILLTESYRHAEASVVAPFEYTSMLLAIAIGYLVFTEIPTSTTLIGAALIMVAGLFIIWREHRLGPRRARRSSLRPAGATHIDRRAALRQCSWIMLIFKVFRAPEWADLLRNGSTPGSPVDRADGFVHFSTAGQLPETLRRHYVGETGLVLVAMMVERGGPWLRWEPSRHGELFPHLYRDLETEDVHWSRELSDEPAERLLPAEPTCV